MNLQTQLEKVFGFKSLKPFQQQVIDSMLMDDDILVGAPEDDDFHIPGMGGVLLCHEGETHAKQSKLKEMQ